MGSDPADIGAIISVQDELKKIACGHKADTGKSPVTLIPKDFILGMADVFGKGAIKYDRHNFRKGIALSRTLDAAMRHILAFAERENDDSETNLSHLLHAGCSLAMCYHSFKNYPDLDDRPSK